MNIFYKNHCNWGYFYSKVTIKKYTWVLLSHKFLSKSDQKQKIFNNRTFFVNKQLTDISKKYTWVLLSHKFSSKSDQKQKFFINRTFFVNKQLTLFFNFLQNLLLNFAQNLRECSFNLVGSESGEKSTTFQFFAYISQLFVYKTRLWT